MKHFEEGELLSVMGLTPSEEGGLIFVRYKKKKVKNKKARKKKKSKGKETSKGYKDKWITLMILSDVLRFATIGLIIIMVVWDIVKDIVKLFLLM